MPSVSPRSTAAAKRPRSSRSRRGSGQRRPLAVASGHAFVERRARPLQRPLDRGFGAVEHLRDLGGVKAQHVPQHERGPLPRRQMLQPSHEGEADRLSRLVACLRPWSGVREPFEQNVGIRVEPDRLDSAGGLGRLDHAGLLGSASAAAKRVQAAVGRDPVEPRAQGGACLETVESAPRRQQRLLHLVFRVLQRAENSVAVQLQLPPIRLDQLPEGVLVSRAGAGERVLTRHHS